MTAADSDPEAIIEELINASEGIQWAMYNSDLEASWATERERWKAARRAAFAVYPGMADRLEDPDQSDPDPAPVAVEAVPAAPSRDYLVHWSFPPACLPALPTGDKWTGDRGKITCPACDAILESEGPKS